MHILTIMRLGDVKVQDKLSPLLASPLVTKLTLVRHAAVPLESPKLTQVIHDVGLDGTGLQQNWLAVLRNLWACFANGLRIAHQQKPDLVLGFFLLPYGLLALLVARLTGRRAVVSLIGTDYNLYVRRRWSGTLMRFFLRRFDAVVVFGEEARQRLIERYGFRADRIFTLPNCVNSDVFRPDPSVAPDTDLVYVGYLYDFKRVDLLLHALAEVRETRPATSLMIIGEGPERDRLTALAESLGLHEGVTFAGWSDCVVALLQRARIFISLSETEGLPMAMLEAMATGLPPVVTGVGAINSVVRDEENGYLLEAPADPALVADRVLRLLNSPDHHAQLRSQALAVGQTHGYPRATTIWEQILQAVTGADRPFV